MKAQLVIIDEKDMSIEEAYSKGNHLDAEEIGLVHFMHEKYRSVEEGKEITDEMTSQWVEEFMLQEGMLDKVMSAMADEELFIDEEYIREWIVKKHQDLLDTKGPLKAQQMYIAFKYGSNEKLSIKLLTEMVHSYAKQNNYAEERYSEWLHFTGSQVEGFNAIGKEAL
tara:strand:- start:250 stop:753 length:504 start_codon:yes stop_codon:yes gene_type:complete